MKKKPYCSVWSNILWSIKGQLKYSPAVFYIQALEAPVHVGLSWAAIYLPSLVVAEVTEKKDMSHAALSIGGLLSAILCASLLDTVMQHLIHAQNGMYRCTIQNKLNQKSMNCFYQTYEKKKMHDLQKRAERATQTWDGVTPIEDMTKHAWKFAESVACYILFGTVVSFVSPWLLFALTLAPAVNWFCVRAYQRWEYSNREKWTDIDRKLWYVQSKTSDFAAAKDIRIYGMAEWLTQTYRMLCAEHAVWNKKKIDRNFLSHLADLAIILLRDGAAYAILISMMLRGELAIDQFVLCFAAISSFASWIGSIINGWNQMRYVSLRLCDLREYLEYPEEDGTGEAEIEQFAGRMPDIVFDHVSFRYEGAKEDTLHDICLTIHSGEKLALVGLNGAGKTTLVKLLCGLYRPTSGEIRIGGIPNGKFLLANYYKLFSPVFQKVEETFFSLAEIVSCRTDGQSDFVRAEECMRKAGLGKKLDSLPKGIHSRLDKQVNEDGIELSGGELQKLMLARALYKDAPVLVLDEPTAALDPIAESEIYQQYENMTQAKSSLFISHRLASTRFCDRILYLKNGRITEEGTHNALAAAEGEYAELYKMQSCWYQDAPK